MICGCGITEVILVLCCLQVLQVVVQILLSLPHLQVGISDAGVEAGHQFLFAEELTVAQFLHKFHHLLSLLQAGLCISIG